MARNHTIIHEHPAEFKAPPFARPTWTVGHWQAQRTEPYAASTLARAYLDAGWRELGMADLRGCFGPPVTKGPFIGNYLTGGVPVQRAFVHTWQPGGRLGRVVTLTDKRALRPEARPGDVAQVDGAGGCTMKVPLNEIMEFDHVIEVRDDGTVTDLVPPGLYAPDLNDGELQGGGWSFFTHGYSGQHAYSGPILAQPGDQYVAVAAYWSPEEDDDPDDGGPIEGWAVAYHPVEPGGTS